jgi:hypothetical protein
MNAKHHWAWFLLVCVCTLGFAWTHRYEYSACDTDGCIAVNRWTGSVAFREAGSWGPAAPDGHVAILPRRERP